MYPPLLDFGYRVIMSTTTLIRTNIAVAARRVAEIPQMIKSNFEPLIVKRYVNIKNGYSVCLFIGYSVCDTASLQMILSRLVLI
jgi:hypothetical protein